MSKGLMRKTKQELVDIILRKDDVEVQLQKQVKACQEELEQVKQINQNYSLDIDNLNKNLEIANELHDSINKDLSETIAQKQEIIDGLEDLVEETQLSLLYATKRKDFCKYWAIITTMIAVIEIMILLELMF